MFLYLTEAWKSKFDVYHHYELSMKKQISDSHNRINQRNNRERINALKKQMLELATGTEAGKQLVIIFFLLLFSIRLHIFI